MFARFFLVLLLHVGETNGEKLTLPWCKPPTPANYTTRSIKEGDEVVFDWAVEYHNAWIYPSGDCNDRTDRTFLGEQAPVSYTFKSEDVGNSITFVCDVSDHCKVGQFVVFDVFGADEDIKYTTETPCGEGYVGEKVVEDPVPHSGSGSGLARKAFLAVLGLVVAGGFLS